MANTDVWHIKDPHPEKDITLISYVQELSNKVTSMFEFTGLPESVNENFFKLNLILTGQCALYKTDKWQNTTGIENWVNDSWVAVHGQRSGEPNVYYIPKGYVIANPAIKSETIPDYKTNPNITIFYLTPFDECTTLGSGLYGLIMRTAHKLADIDVSIKTAVINSRVVALWEVDNDAQQSRVNETLRKMRQGEDVFAIKTGYESEIKINPYLQGANLPETIRELVELRQYILANFYHALGINSNYNLKRAQISNKEIETNDDVLIVNTAEIIKQLTECCKEFTAKTGIELSVDYSEAWKQLKETETNTNETEEEPKEGVNDDDNTDDTGKVTRNSEKDGD